MNAVIPINQRLQTLVSTVLNEHKALDITTLSVQHITTLTNTILICTATSQRHSKALAEYVLKAVKAQAFQPLGVEGKQEGEWILIDLIDIIVHIMLAPARAFYSLERLWNFEKT